MTTESRQRRTRRYTKRRRADQEQHTRERITAAAVRLHGTVGPARTTVSAIADEAGVQRATVYRHFPDDESLFDACTAHYLSRHPMPDPTGWMRIEDPTERCRRALTELYAWWAETEEMMARVLRDAPLMEAAGAAQESFFGYFEGVRAALMRGRRERGRARTRVSAAIGFAIGFATWHSLVSEEGLDTAEAVELMVRMVAGAGRASRPPSPRPAQQPARGSG